jgi:hypothetical protein
MAAPVRSRDHSMDLHATPRTMGGARRYSLRGEGAGLTIPPENRRFHDDARSRLDAYRADPRNSLLSDRGIAALALAHALMQIRSLEEKCNRLRASLAEKLLVTTGTDRNARGEPRAGVSDFASLDHVVQFYGDGAELAKSMAGFVETGLRENAAVIVVATAEHLAPVHDRLTALGVDLVDALSSGQYQTFDAEELLGCLMVNGSPDRTRFEEVVGALVADAQWRWSRVRIFGEMVALLWANHDVVGALFLEELWNELHGRLAFSLLCAYPKDGSSRDLVESSFGRVCEVHARVISPPPIDSPGEPGPSGHDSGRRRSR